MLVTPKSIRLLGALLGLSMSSIAWAQVTGANNVAVTTGREATGPNEAASEAPDPERLFREGREAQERGDCKLALKLFLASHRLKLGRGKLINIAVCEKELGRWTEALRRFKAVSLQIEPSDPRYAFVQQNIAELEAKMPYVRFTRSGTMPADATIWLDAALVPSASVGISLPINPGHHVIVVEAEGRVDRKQELVVKSAERLTITVAAGPVVAALPGQSIAADDEIKNNNRKNNGITIGILGVGTGVIASSFAMANHLQTADVESSTRTKVSLVLGGLALGVGIAGFTVAGTTPTRRPTEYGLGISVSPTGSQVLLGGSF